MLFVLTQSNVTLGGTDGLSAYLHKKTRKQQTSHGKNKKITFKVSSRVRTLFMWMCNVHDLSSYMTLLSTEQTNKHVCGIWKTCRAATDREEWLQTTVTGKTKQWKFSG